VEFGTSGFLYRSNKLMYDRKTETLWQQFRGVPAVGPLVGSGLELEVLPMTLTFWADWVAEHPDTTVLNAETGRYPAESYSPESQNDSAYFAYRNQTTTMFPVPLRSAELETKEPVFGLVVGDEARAYPLSVFASPTALNDELGGQNVVVLSPGSGGGVRAYGRGNHVFTPARTGPGRMMVVTDEDGVEWRAEDDALVSLDGAARSLDRLPSREAYWFGWYAFYPQTDIYAP